MTDQGESTKIHLHLQAEGRVQTGYMACRETSVIHRTRALEAFERPRLPLARQFSRLRQPKDTGRCWLASICRLLALIASSSMQSHARFHANEAGTGLQERDELVMGEHMFTHVDTSMYLSR